MTVAEYIAEKLRQLGVRYVFGIPGGPSIPYMEAFRKVNIEFILTSNESSAAIMADVTYRLTGVPGICHATFGPGATNLTTGIGGAFLDRSAVIAFTSETGDKMINRTTQMNVNHQKLFEPITKKTFRADPANIYRLLNSAITVCREEYPGPVHIGLPAGIDSMQVNEYGSDESFSEYGNRNNNSQQIINIIKKSKRPLIAAGLTAARSNTGEKLITFLSEFKIPVIMTPMAKGILPEDHSCYAGVLFHSLSDYLEDLYNKCDLVIGLGYDTVEFDYENWLPDVPLIHFDTRIEDLPERDNIYPFSGEPDEWFRILRSFDSLTLEPATELIEGIKSEMNSVFKGFTGHFGPVAAMNILQEELPSDAFLTADVGSHLHLAGQFWKTGKRGKILMTNGWSGMGFGLPAALAAQLLNKEATVVCLTGDGGFLMMAGELITARRYNLPVIVVVFSDGELNLIKVKQGWRDLPPYSTLLYQGDLFGSDTFLGIRVITATDHRTMKKAVIDALALDEPVIINAVIDPEDYKWLIVRQ